jgi:hypothetical protein
MQTMEFELRNVGCSRKSGNASTLSFVFYDFLFVVDRLEFQLQGFARIVRVASPRSTDRWGAQAANP